jgi:AcrR family transcriptional regulator
MTSPQSQRETLLTLTIDAASRQGLDGISLRSIVSDAGTSTTAIFQNYSGKSELIADAVRAAIAHDKAFHRDLREQAFTLISGHLSFADFIASYVELRAASNPARFLAEVLVKAPDHPQCLDLLIEWHDDRQRFWADLIALHGLTPGFAAIVGDYVLMEEYYAHALMGQMQYRLLLHESARALSDAAFHDGQGSTIDSGVSLALGIMPFSARPPSSSGGHVVAGKLLDAAVQLINRSGIGAINQRAIARAVGVANSMIPYHFNDMKNFTTQAIWHALVQGIPIQLDPDHEKKEELPQNLSEWLGILDQLLQSATPDRDAGFYVSFSRLTGEASLMAGRNPALLPLIVYLRGLEGWGTYRVSRSIESLAQRIGRDHAAAFGVWIKAEAILRGAGLVDNAQGVDRLTRTANLIFPREAMASTKGSR